MAQLAEQWIAEQTGTITLYHGTSKARLENILQDGLVCYRSFGADRGQPSGIFCTYAAHKRYSQHWAQRKAKQDNSEPVVLRVNVDASSVIPDPVNPRCFLIVTQNIEPVDIVEIDNVPMVGNMSFANMATYASQE